MRADYDYLVGLLGAMDFRDCVIRVNRILAERVADQNLYLDRAFPRQSPNQRIVLMREDHGWNWTGLVLVPYVNHVEYAVALVRIAQDCGYALIKNKSFALY
jgi:hypothetical protein